MQVKKASITSPATPLRGAAAQFVESKLAAGAVAFSLDELVENTGLSIIAARNQLLRLGNKVVRVSPRQQFFLIVRPDHQVMGGPPVEWWLDAYFRWLGRPYYLALQTAAASHGSSPQAIQVTQVMTDLPRRDLRIGRVRVHFFVKRAVARTPTRQPIGAYAPLCVSTPEATAFDLVRYAPNIGGIERSAETIAPMIPQMQSSKLRGVLEAEDETTTAQRLGFILEAQGADKLAKTIRAWLPQKLAWIPLATHAPENVKPIAANNRWQIFANTMSLS